MNEGETARNTPGTPAGRIASQTYPGLRRRDALAT